MGISSANAADLFGLAGTQDFRRVQTPGAREQALAAQYFVDAGYAASKAMRRIENRGVGVGQFNVPLQEFTGDSGAFCNGAMAFAEQFHRTVRPDRPLAEQTADDSAFDDLSIARKSKGGEQV